MALLYSLDDLVAESEPLRSQCVFVRVDFNVPMEGSKITDDSRLIAAVPTLRELASLGSRLLLASHRGRPKGAVDPALSLRPVASRLSELLGQPVAFVSDCVGARRRDALDQLPDGGMLLLENLRFHAGEKSNDAQFAEQLSESVAAYVDDAFGCAHRAHASITGVPKRVQRKAAGRLMVREVEALSSLLGEPERPFVAVVGGAKIAGKIDTLESLVARVDRLLIGGGMANTFLAAEGLDLGNSLIEREALPQARSILDRARRRQLELLLPTDVVTTKDLEASLPSAMRALPGELPAGAMAVDIGPDTIQRYRAALSDARTVFWNGPMGVFEKPPFDRGSLGVADAIAASHGFSVIGGGETVAVAHRAGVTDKIQHVSTGGGASLELLAGRSLPGVEALEKS